jgi:hypothetical protein
MKLENKRIKEKKKSSKFKEICEVVCNKTLPLLINGVTNTSHTQRKWSLLSYYEEFK